MPNAYKNKVVYGGTTLIDLTDATATADKILNGYTAYGATGAKLEGTCVVVDIAREFDTTETYDIGDYVIYDGQLYRCITAVTTAGAWDASKWTAVYLADEVDDKANTSDIPSASSTTPSMDGTPSVGTGTTWARADHVHPSDTSRQAAIKSGSITLSAVWSGGSPYTQTVTVTGTSVTSDSKVDLQPDAAVLAQLIDDEVQALWIENDNGILTAKALGAEPTAAMTVQCTVTEINA